jgi:hypothetical protein
MAVMTQIIEMNDISEMTSPLTIIISEIFRPFLANGPNSGFGPNGSPVI